MNPHYKRVTLRAGLRCEYCHAPEVVFNFPFEVEHIIPLVREGTDTVSNWALACRACNVRKGAHIEHEDPVARAVVRLYRSREAPWEAHFRVEMNSPAQCVARQHWISLGLFP
jgi:5-methylcytosine-specific restriction endonuclease McrA